MDNRHMTIIIPMHSTVLKYSAPWYAVTHRSRTIDIPYNGHMRRALSKLFQYLSQCLFRPHHMRSTAEMRHKGAYGNLILVQLYTHIQPYRHNHVGYIHTLQLTSTSMNKRSFTSMIPTMSFLSLPYTGIRLHPAL